MDDTGSWAGWGSEPGSLQVAPTAQDIGLHDLFMQTSLPQALTDPEGRFVMANRAYCDLVGYGDQELLTHTLDDITHPEDVTAQARAREQLIVAGEPVAHCAPRYLRGDGAVLRCRVALAVVRDDEERVRYVHCAVERVEAPAVGKGGTGEEPVVVPHAAIASRQLNHVLQTLTSGQAHVVLIRLEGLEEVAGVIGWGGVERAFGQIVTRIAGTARIGIRAIIPVGAIDVLVIADSADAGTLPTVLQSVLRTPVSLSGFRLPVSVRLGVTSGRRGDDPETLVRQARVALNHAVRTGAPEVRYEPELDAAALHDFALSIEIAHALANNDFGLHYQPKYTLEPLEPVGFEALLRWSHPDRGPVPPEGVVGLAESSGLIVPLTCWVIDTAAAQAARWRDAGTPTRIAVNISPAMLTNPLLPLRLSQATSRHQLPANALALEITETALATGSNAIIAVSQLADLGYWIHVDDFGTGYSSLAAIRSLPLRAIKIDRSFVQNMLTEPRDRAVVAAIIEVTHQLGAHVIAEGVEDEATLDLLRILGCDMAQGYHLGRPLPAADVTEHLRPGV